MSSTAELRHSLFNIPASKKVCRSLFGPVDHDVIKVDFQKEFKEALQLKTKLWNFDFELNLPKDKEDGLKWDACPSKVAEYTIKPGVSLITSFLQEEQMSKTIKTYQERSFHTSPGEEVKNSFSTNDIKSRLEEDNNNVKSYSNVEKDEEGHVVRIVNASPTRPHLYRAELKGLTKHSAVSPDILSCRRKRKRDSQPRIDDFMKKKKPRVSMDLSSSKRAPRNDVFPISKRLRRSSHEVSA